MVATVTLTSAGRSRWDRTSIQLLAAGSSLCSTSVGTKASVERPPSGAPQIDFGQLLDAYRAVQQKHRAKDDGKRREARVGDGAEGDAATPRAASAV